jgi:hypothetical protein
MSEFNISESIMNTLEIQESIINKIILVNYVIIVILGLIGNLSTIYLVIKTKKSHKQAANIYISNLAIADLCVIFLVIPENCLRLMQIHTDDIWSSLFCKYSGFTHGVLLAVSVMSLTAISIDRYYIINKPIKARQLSHSKTKSIVFFIWFISVCIMAPMIAVSVYEKIDLPNFNELSITININYNHSQMNNNNKNNKNIFICKEEWPNLELKICYNIFLSFFLFFLPVSFMLYAFVQVNKTLSIDHSNHVLKRFKNNNSKSKSNSEKQNSLKLSDNNNATSSLVVQLELTNRNSSAIDNNNNNGNCSGMLRKATRNEQAILNLIMSRQRVVRLLIVLIILFFISWFPYHLVCILIDFMHIAKLNVDYLTEYVFPITLFLAHANSAQNPICFLLIRKDFFRKIKNKCKFCF